MRIPAIASDAENALEARRPELEAQHRQDAAPPPALHPAMAEIYRRKVGDLAAALSAPDCRDEAAAILRGLIDAIELHPGAEGYEIRLRGDLAGMLALGQNGKKPAAISGVRTAAAIGMPSGNTDIGDLCGPPYCTAKQVGDSGGT